MIDPTKKPTIKAVLHAVSEWEDFRKKESARISDLVKQVIQDKSLPLDERWELFLESGLGSEGNYIHHFETLEGGKFKSWARNPVNDFLCDLWERHQVVQMVDLADQLNDMVGVEFDIVATYEDHCKGNVRVEVFTDEDFVAWKEEVLSTFIKSFTFDW